MINAIKHYLNPLHIYCRLRDTGLSKKKAIFIGSLYEDLFFRHFLIRHISE
jgi:hypothetical protein